MIDKDFCCSSFLAFRYIEKDDIDFFENMKHRSYKLPDDNELTLIGDCKELDEEIRKVFDKVKEKKLGI